MNHHAPRTSAVLAALPETFTGDHVALGDIVAALRQRAFGFMILIFGLPNVLPVPPGIPTLCGLVLTFLSIQLLIGRTSIWLPERIMRRAVPRSVLLALAHRGGALVRRVEAVMRPRFEAATGPVGRRIVAAIVLLLGVVLWLPFPVLGSLPPGIAVCLLGLGLIERDGIMVAAGAVAAVVAVAVTGGITVAIGMAGMSLF